MFYLTLVRKLKTGEVACPLATWVGAEPLLSLGNSLLGQFCKNCYVGSTVFFLTFPLTINITEMRHFMAKNTTSQEKQNQVLYVTQ